MKFEEVLPALRNGKKIRRSFWREDTYFYKNDQGNFIFKNGGADEYYYNLTCLLFSGDWEIVKEPKKVKLRDLTEAQFRKYLNGCVERKCAECPLNDVVCYPSYVNCLIKHKDLYSDKFLEQEIELQEE